MYHRVAELDSDPQLLAVTPDHFAEHLQVLRAQSRLYPLTDLAAALKAGRLPRRAVAITLDDGYADNLFNAEPVLNSHEIHATVFVAAGHVGSGREFWWDELDRLLLEPGTLPKHLEITVRGHLHRWLLDGAATYDREAYERHRDWHIERPHDPTTRHAMYRAIYSLAHALSPCERDAVLDDLRRQAGVSANGRPSHRALTESELVKLSRSSVIDIGAHTMTHPVLAAQSAAVQHWEIQHSKSRLEEMLGMVVTTFAYPHGSGTQETVNIVRETGFEYACSTSPDVVTRDADLLMLPRLGVRDWDRERFSRFLSYWLDG
jgi:peptidoglycan/xylan/chitin deacetylase (PgdA/CDA1 family)